MNYKDKVISKLMKIKGIEATYVLTKKDRNEILKSERKAEEQILSGCAMGFNLGLRKVLEREVVIAFLHNENYEWPQDPTVQLICENELVGEEIKDKKRFLSLKHEGKVILFGDSFALYTNKLELMKKARPESMYFLFPPLKMPQIGDLQDVLDVILSIPSTPADLYLKERMREQGIDVSKKRLGTALLGFNAVKVSQ